MQPVANTVVDTIETVTKTVSNSALDALEFAGGQVVGKSQNQVTDKNKEESEKQQERVQIAEKRRAQINLAQAQKEDTIRAKRELEEIRKKLGLSNQKITEETQEVKKQMEAMMPKKKEPTVADKVKQMMSNTQTGERRGTQGAG